MDEALIRILTVVILTCKYLSLIQVHNSRAQIWTPQFIPTGSSRVSGIMAALGLGSVPASGKSIIPPRIRKLSTLSICLVPPPTAKHVWEILTKARTQLKDPGLFRWPPHVNLLYPFVNIDVGVVETWKEAGESAEMVDPDIIRRLEIAVQRVEAFSVTLDHFGIFGGTKRGVLWMYPTTYSPAEGQSQTEPIRCLYQSLVREFPECSSSPSRDFNPHMTLSHFESLHDAEVAREEIQTWWPPQGLQFNVNEIYVLQRKGDGDQFMRVASLGLGRNSTIRVHDPHLPFPDMPSIEEDWVRSERLKLKQRRNGRTR